MLASKKAQGHLRENSQERPVNGIAYCQGERTVISEHLNEVLQANVSCVIDAIPIVQAGAKDIKNGVKDKDDEQDHGGRHEKHTLIVDQPSA